MVNRHAGRYTDGVNFDPTSPRRPTLLEALTPLFAMGVLLAVGFTVLGYPVEVLLLASAGVAGNPPTHSP